MGNQEEPKTEIVKEEKKSEIIKQQNQTPIDIIALAIDKGVDLERIEKLLVLQERYDKSEGKKKYNMAMAEVHKEMPAVVKSAENTQTHSKNAKLEHIIVAAKPVYAGKGFSICFYEGDTPKSDHVRLCMDITHSAGHKETYHYDMPLDGVGLKGNANMTKIHGKSSSVSYGRRYLLCMGLNIATYDDDDGNAAGQPVISEEQVFALEEWISSKNASKDKFLAYMKVKNLSEIPASEYNKAETVLKNYKGGNNGQS